MRKRLIQVYIAAPWIHKEAARQAATVFESQGFVVTKTWWEHPEVPGYLKADITAANRDELVVQAQEDYDGVVGADVLVLLNFAKSEGKAVETGIALTAGVPIVLVGEKSNLFHYWPDIEQVLTVYDAPAAARNLVEGR